MHNLLMFAHIQTHTYIAQGDYQGNGKVKNIPKVREKLPPSIMSCIWGQTRQPMAFRPHETARAIYLALACFWPSPSSSDGWEPAPDKGVPPAQVEGQGMAAPKDLFRAPLAQSAMFTLGQVCHTPDKVTYLMLNLLQHH